MNNPAHSDKILFDITIRSDPPRPAKVFRYQLTITNSRWNTVEANLVIRGAGSFPHCRFGIGVTRYGSGLFMGPQDLEMDGIGPWYSYHPVERYFPVDTPNAIDDVASKTPVVVAPLGVGKFLGACSMFGRVVYLRKSDNGREDPGNVVCADYLS